MTIYIDSDYKCHTVEGEGYTAVEAEAFDGKCAEYIEGYRYVPEGESWTRKDGVVFAGEMIAPWKDFGILEKYQQQAELADMQAALELLGVTAEEGGDE